MHKLPVGQYVSPMISGHDPFLGPPVLSRLSGLRDWPTAATWFRLRFFCFMAASEELPK